MPAQLHALQLQAVCEWLLHPHDDMTVYQMHLPGASPAIRRVIFQQNAIGWEQMFLGCFSSECASLQDEYYARRARSIETKRQTGQRWQITIISSIWQHWFQLWALRNRKALHGAEARAQAQADRRVIERMLTDIYDLRNQMEPSIQQLHRDLTEHFSKTVTYNKNWLAVHRSLFKRSIKRAKAKAILGVKTIRHYFGTK